MAASLLVAGAVDARPKLVTLTIVGTSDVHGHLESYPVLGGYLRILRSVRARDGAVLLLDGGDVFQGTIESNMEEGAPMIEAMNALGYAAAAIGNHDFDFGPVGPAATPQVATDDARGALRARAAEARFPFLMANVVDAATGKPPAWKNVAPSVLLDLPAPARLKVGVVGATTMETPRATIARNFEGLRMLPLAGAITAEAKALRDRGADIVVLVAHAGGNCARTDDPRDLGSCRPDAEIFQVARALPPGLVDAIVGGHTHRAVAHLCAGVPVAVSWSNGRAFGRIDLVWDAAARRVVRADLFPPRDLCRSPEGPCEPGRYARVYVQPDPAIAAAVAPALGRAAARKAETLGVDVTAKVWRSLAEESPEGNLFADLLRQMVPGADLALVNRGGLRADIPAGPLTYGAVFEAFPFDNRVASARTTGAALRRMFERNVTGSGPGMSVSGLRVRATCAGGKLDVALTRETGRPVRDDERLLLATSDFMATGGDGLMGEAAAGADLLPQIIREEMVRLLRARGGRLDPGDPAVYDKARPRIALPGPRPVNCAAAATPSP